MDLDAALARQLQAEEQLQARQAGLQSQQGAGSAPQQQAFASRLRSCLQHAASYEDELLQALAQSVMPMDRLIDSADKAAAPSAALQEQPVRQREDLLAQELLTWFKHEFFTWVNSPACSHCGSQDVHGTGAAQPTAEEAQSQAGRVEVHTCRACNCTTRFPRYNDPAKLLETRSGRCGEWANCFTLCCRAAGLEARYIMDWTDHVWTEYYSHAHQRWIHLDPCEAAYDKPLLYEAGWGKQLSYVVAFSRHGVTDVIKRYTKQWDQLRQRRTLVSEDWLTQQCTHLTSNTRREWSAEERAVWRERDAREQAELAGQANAPTTPQDLHLPGRQTGSEGWRAARGELGTPSAPPAPSTSTSFQLAGDDGVADSDPGRLCGGVVRASGEHQPHQTAVRAFDGGLQHKWLDFGGANSGTTWLEYRLVPSQAAVTVTHYSLTSAEDEPSRDPCDFVLEGSVECHVASDGAAWRQLDAQQGVTFPERHQTRSFTLQHPLPCRSYRLVITAVRDAASANSVQLAKLDLYIQLDPTPQPHPSLLGSVHQLQAAASQADAGSGSAVLESIGTLLQILCNIVQHPSESKHRILRVENAKIKAMLSGHSEISNLLRIIGFRDSQLSRQGKQPPEAALTLDSSETTSQAVMHALTLLQTPMSAQQHHSQDAARSPLVPQDKQAEQDVPSRQLDPTAADSPDVLATDQGLAGNSAVHQPQPTSAQPGIGDLATARSEQGPDASSHRVVSNTTADVQVTTDASDPPVLLTDAPGIAQAGDAIATEAEAAEAQSQYMPETPQVPGMTAGSNQDRPDETPGFEQPTPAALRRQTKATVPASALAGFQKLQLQTPAADGTKAAGMPTPASDSTAAMSSEAIAVSSRGKTDLKTLVHEEFARLMASKAYSPNEAAILAVQHVSQQN